MIDSIQTVSVSVEKVMSDGSCLFVLPDGTKITASPAADQNTTMAEIRPGGQIQVELSPPSKAERGRIIYRLK